MTSAMSAARRSRESGFAERGDRSGGTGRPAAGPGPLSDLRFMGLAMPLIGFSCPARDYTRSPKRWSSIRGAEAGSDGPARRESEPDVDRMNEMSEMTSLRLQMTMDRRAKFIQALSNMMNKASAAQETLVQNIK